METAIFNSVENSSCDQAQSDFCNTNIAFDNGMTVDLFEMKAVIDDLGRVHTCSGREPDSSVLGARVRFASTRAKNRPAANRSRPVK